VSEKSLTLPAFAKINLLLRVLGRRADDFHEIHTVFQTVTLHDNLVFEKLADQRLEIVCDTPGIPVDERNLVHRAARALGKHFDSHAGARIKLEKKIPVEGGLGGGSSDAAVTLIGLASLWEVKTDARELTELGARIGSDVPFFLTGGTALGTGLGTDILSLEDVPQKHLVIVTPGEKVSTAEAYKSLNAPALTKAESVVNLPISRADAKIPDSLCNVMRNDFEPVIYGLRPEIKRARNALLEVGAQCALLAGSGSSVFGIFESVGESQRARDALATDERRWQVFACETLSRAAYRNAFGACAAFL
jgi:4-diphosphocytidyl-2-C-methyl-D-erythritol kinase